MFELDDAVDILINAFNRCPWWGVILFCFAVGYLIGHSAYPRLIRPLILAANAPGSRS